MAPVLAIADMVDDRLSSTPIATPLERLRHPDWLQQCGVTTVALQSTGGELPLPFVRIILCNESRRGEGRNVVSRVSVRWREASNVELAGS